VRKPQVCVIGASDETEHIEECRAIGRFIADQGWTLVTGGRGGVMEAVSRGASEGGGIVVGILPGDDDTGANEYCTVIIPTGIGFARNSVNVLSADIIVAVGGRAGTLSELAYAWIYGKPVICCTFAQGWSRTMSQLAVDDLMGSRIYIAGTAEEACRHLRTHLRQ
jgi:uncharacterized protein (TIGR00725 family)